MRIRHPVATAALAAFGVCGLAVEARAQDKSSFTLFNPTPRGLMRDFSTDRPDTTESPYTVDAGHFQLEMSFVEYARDDDAGDFDEFAVAPMNIKFGLLNNVDLQLVLDPYVHQRFEGDNADGFGNTQLRLKVNLWGNDEGKTALAVMPFVQFASADNDFGGTDHIEGGLIVPLAIALPQEWTLGLMAEIDWLRNEADDDYGTALVHTAAIGHPILGELSGFAEYVGVASRELDAGYIALAGGGFTYLLRENVQLDGAIYFGISEAADDLSALLGISLRH